MEIAPTGPRGGQPARGRAEAGCSLGALRHYFPSRTSSFSSRSARRQRGASGSGGRSPRGRRAGSRGGCCSKTLPLDEYPLDCRCGLPSRCSEARKHFGGRADVSEESRGALAAPGRLDASEGSRQPGRRFCFRRRRHPLPCLAVPAPQPCPPARGARGPSTCARPRPPCPHPSADARRTMHGHTTIACGAAPGRDNARWPGHLARHDDDPAAGRW